MLIWPQETDEKRDEKGRFSFPLPSFIAGFHFATYTLA